jgi:hypothetical protein
MAPRNSAWIYPGRDDDFSISSTTIGQEPSPAAKRALEIYRASILRRIEERRRRRKDQAEPTS